MRGVDNGKPWIFSIQTNFRNQRQHSVKLKTFNTWHTYCRCRKMWKEAALKFPLLKIIDNPSKFNSMCKLHESMKLSNIRSQFRIKQRPYSMKKPRRFKALYILHFIMIKAAVLTFEMVLWVSLTPKFHRKQQHDRKQQPKKLRQRCVHSCITINFLM